MKTFLDAALEYHGQGLHPIPVEPKGKRPLVPWKDFQTTQPTIVQLVEWWTSTPDANVGLVLGRGMFAVDVDGPEGEAALREAGVDFHFDTPCSSTGKGKHLFVAGSSPDKVGLLPKVDIRGVGFVVAPPSIHASGKTYAWITEMENIAELPPAPPALVALLSRATPTVSAPQAGQNWLTEALAGVGEGGRDVTCTRLAGYLLGKGLPAEATYELLLGWAARCEPPFPEADVQKCVESIAKREPEPEPPPSDIAGLMPGLIASLKRGVARLQPTGDDTLDGMLDGGMQRGEYILLGARPGVGKTALALQLARRSALAGRSVLYISREMTRENLLKRMLCQQSCVSASKLKAGNLDELDWKQIEAAVPKLVELPLWISTLSSVDQLKDAVADFKGELNLLIVDYLQLLRGPMEMQSRGDKRALVEHISSEIRTLTLTTGIPAIVLSSLSRPPRDMPRWRPQLADLRESGELEHDADIVMLLHREAGAEEIEVNVAKNRDGRVGMQRMRFLGETLTFEKGA
jgi:KaiC/GvpD/RAD55 family RecA-like ATPase